MATTASVYNISRTNRQILRRHRKDRPSFVLHLHNNHFRFERQNGMFLFDSPVKAFLQFIRDQRVPADLIDVLTDSGVQFFEGCLIAEVHDHRSHSVAFNSTLSPSHLHSMANGPGSRQPRDMSGATSSPSSSQTSTLSLFYLQEGGRYGARNVIGGAGPSNSYLDGKHGAMAGIEIYRIVLHPTAETLWSDLKMLDDMTGGIWSDQDALEVEAKILSLTAPPLCLTPDPQATRIANLMLSSTAPPFAYAPSSSSPLPFHRNASKKRGANSIEMEKEEASRQRREKIMRMMEGGLRSTPAVKPPDGSTLPGVASVSNVQAAAASNAFVPTFGRMAFIEKWRMGRNLGPNPMALQNGAHGSKDDGSKTSAAANANDDKPEPAKKPPAKKKKKAQREKEEAEATAAAAAAEAKKKEEEAAAATAAAAKKDAGKGLSKKKKAQLAKERERKEKEEKEKAERKKEEKEKKEKDQPAKKSKSKKKDDGAAAAAAAGAGANGPGAAANGDKDAVGGSKNTSPTKDKAANGDITTPSKAEPVTSVTIPTTGGKKPAPAKKFAAKKPAAASKASKAKASHAKPKGNETGDVPMSAATPASVQSTPTLPHALPNAQAAMFMQQQQQAGAAGQQMGAGSYYGMPMMNGAAPMFPNGGMGMGMGMMPGVSMGGPQQNAAGVVGVGMGMNMGMMANNGQGQNGGFMNAGGAGGGGYQGMPQGVDVGMMPGGHQGGQQQQGNIADLPVGVGLAGLGNWGGTS